MLIEAVSLLGPAGRVCYSDALAVEQDSGPHFHQSESVLAELSPSCWCCPRISKHGAESLLFIIWCIEV